MTRACVVLLDKRSGVTSFGALGAVKRAFHTKKVGHTGTLDKFATGLIVALIGRATKLAQFVTGLDKRYDAVVRFGEETTTLDPEGEIVAKADVPAYCAVEAAIPHFIGTISQRPPAYSAVHVGGERAYKLARAGVAVAVPERRVQISSLDLVAYDPPDLRLRIACSSGTYIRSLARDLALAADSRAHVVELSRSAIGPFEREEAVSPDELSTDGVPIELEEFVPRIPGLSIATVTDRVRRDMELGRTIREEMLSDASGSLIAAFSEGGRFLGILDRTDGAVRYRFNRGTDE